MRLTNIHSIGREVTIFSRDDEGNLVINTDKSLFPYYYEKCHDGDIKSFDGEKVKKIFVTKPSDIHQQRSYTSYESDILFNKRYMIDKVKEMEKCPIKYAFIDIEIWAEDGNMPDIRKANHPVSSITIYNSLTTEIKNFFLNDYKSEFEMLDAFCKFMKEESFDIWLSWNVAFDYNYLHNRIPDFPKKISPIGEDRWAKDDIRYPAGISIIDYLLWFKKITLNKHSSYALDAIAEDVLGKGKHHSDVDFSVVDETVRERNIEDVEIMRDLEAKKNVIPYYDEVRRLSKVEWEDLEWNSRIIDSLILQEAFKQNIVLPMKPKDNEKEDFEGAYREAYNLGAHWNIGKYDLASAYPNMIIDFCLDPSNCSHGQNTPEAEAPVLTLEGNDFIQNSGALLPTVCKKLLEMKKVIGEEKKNTSVDAPNYADIKQRYDAIKTIVNSAYGVMGNRFFRLYDNRVASTTTFLVRDLLHFVRDRLEAEGKRVIYVDTDSVFIDSEEDLTDYLNDLIAEWGRKYGKEKISTDFDYEGSFEKLLILAKCRYFGELRKKNGELEPEVKGVEAKRKDSTKFMKEFQTELVRRILDKESKESIFEWISSESERIEGLPLSEVSFPCKLSRKAEDYKNKPIFIRAMEETEGFEKKIGEKFYYIYVEPEHYEIEKEVEEYYILEEGARPGTTRKKKLSLKKVLEMEDDESDVKIHHEVKTKKVKKARDVKAFDERTWKSIENVDWVKMKDRNIWMKLDTIFGAMGWEINDVKNVRV